MYLAPTERSAIVMPMPASIQELEYLGCHRCGYDLRAHARDANCPECGASVADSQREAKIPRRPAWQKSDPCWRRRMIAGVWVLVFLPLLDVLRATGWAADVPIPSLVGLPGHVSTLSECFLYNLFVYQPILLCIGLVLLFSKERGRQPARLDWTRRWGILLNYIMALLYAVPILFISSLVGVGISAIFLSMPPKYQPAFAPFLLNVTTGFLRYGPYPKDACYFVVIAFSSIAVLLACVPLFNALRSTGSKYLAALLLSPLALFALVNLAQIAAFYLAWSKRTADQIAAYEYYFQPDLLVRGLWHPTDASEMELAEIVKWGVTLAIALWLSIARFVPQRSHAVNRGSFKSSDRPLLK